MHSKLRSKHKVDSKCVKTNDASMKTMEPCLARVESGQGPDNEQFYNQGTNSSKKGESQVLGLMVSLGLGAVPTLNPIFLLTHRSDTSSTYGRFLTPSWEARIEFQATSFALAQSWLLRSFCGSTGIWEYSVLYLFLALCFSSKRTNTN